MTAPERRKGERRVGKPWTHARANAYCVREGVPDRRKAAPEQNAAQGVRMLGGSASTESGPKVGSPPVAATEGTQTPRVDWDVVAWCRNHSNQPLAKNVIQLGDALTAAQERLAVGSLRFPIDLIESHPNDQNGRNNREEAQ